MPWLGLLDLPWPMPVRQDDEEFRRIEWLIFSEKFTGNLRRINGAASGRVRA